MIHGITFDTRAMMLTATINPDWEPEIIAQHERNRTNIRIGLIHQYGNDDHERKVADYGALGPAPWSAVDRHNEFMAQIRSAFTIGAYYPALIGASALGERLLNELVIRLRDDYRDHPATRSVASRQSFSNWSECITALVGWNVLDDQTATQFNDLRKLRNANVHYGAHLVGTDGREQALDAVLLIQNIIEALFAPHGGPPRFIADVSGYSFLALDAEKDPFVHRFLIPAAVLLSPNFRMTHNPQVDWFDVYDDTTYQDEYSTLDDAEFADHLSRPRRPPLNTQES